MHKLISSINPQRYTARRDANKADEENRQARLARRKGAVAEAPEEVVEPVEEAVPEMETAVHTSLDLEEGTPQAMAVTVGKVVAVSAEGSAVSVYDSLTVAIGMMGAIVIGVFACARRFFEACRPSILCVAYCDYYCTVVYCGRSMHPVSARERERHTWFFVFECLII